MVTVSHIVKKRINDSSLLQESVRIGIASSTLLAKYLKPDIEKEFGKRIKLEAISQAIRRYQTKLNEKEKQLNFICFQGIKTDSTVKYLVTDSSHDSMIKLKNLYYEINFDKGDIFNVARGNHETVIVINKEYEDKILEHLSEEEIKLMVDDHVSLSLIFSSDYLFSPGLFYEISRLFVWENINILTWFHTPTELTLIIHENDLPKSYTILNKFIKNKKQLLNNGPLMIPVSHK